MHQLQSFGSSVCLYKFLDICLHNLQWNSCIVKTLFLRQAMGCKTHCFLKQWFESPSHFREFTHRVKSVSMSKFTSQEVEALQRGGNQRAREMYLKDWDIQRQRVPDSSNIGRIREFIKNVYVDKKYAGGKVFDKPPRDMQSRRNHEDETMRASSYHSYSQSPPYENEYEDRKYGKPMGVLSRKPGSDRGHYEGKITGFLDSPGHLAEQMYEDRFANEDSVSRVSDYSVSSTSDPFRHDNWPPSFQEKPNDTHIHHLKEMSVEGVLSKTIGSSDPNFIKDSSGIQRTQRTASSSSFGSFDSNSVTSASLFDVVLEPEQSVEAHPDGRVPVPSGQKTLFPSNAAGFDPFGLQFSSQSRGITSPAIDLFDKPANSASLSQDHFKQLDVTSAPAVGFSSDVTHQNSATIPSEQKSPVVSFPQNEGWATFSLPQQETSSLDTKYVPHASTATGDQVSFSNSSTELPPFIYESQGSFSSVQNQWHGRGHGVQPFAVPASPKSGHASIPAEQKSTNPFDLLDDSNSETSNVLLNMGSLQAALPDSQLPPFVESFDQSWFLPDSVASYIPAAPQGGLAYKTDEAPAPQFPNIPSHGSVASLSGNPFA